MKYRFAMLVVMIMGLWAGTARAQFGFPPDQVDKIRILGVTQWEFKKSEITPTAQEQHYLARLRVQFENRSEYYVVFRDPQFNIAIRGTGGDPTEGKVTRTQSENVETRITTFDPAAGPVTILGPARLPNPADMKLYGLLAPGADVVDATHKTVEFALKPIGKDGKVTIAEVDFIVDCGPVGTETSDRLLLKVFNTVADRTKPWSTFMSGSALLGSRSLSTGATVFAPSPVQIELYEKPPVKIGQ